MLEKKQVSKFSWLKFSFIVILLLVIGAVGYVHSLYQEIQETINSQMYQPLPSIDQVRSEEKLAKMERLHVLLLGANLGVGEHGRAESFMVLSLDPKNETMEIINIPKDTRASIEETGFEDKINHAFAFGGPDMAIESIENLLNTELDFYVQLNLDGVNTLIDALGGITVMNELNLELEDYQLQPGELHLSGSQALRYVQLPEDLLEGDDGQTDRQSQVIDAVIQKGTTMVTLNKIDAISQFLEQNMVTNMDFHIIKELLLNYNGVGKNVTNHTLAGSRKEIDGISYLIIPDEEIEKIHKK
ncbi:LCP family glycopolymer transferase [Ornithinibacillus californiensis]|uniref:LCP family glycopolymer transferase n=1 Tax=Ornithinibacillus californiensis TaxID=161536 RepID=UPI00064D8622|nr:LCP family protein [Ornithinibacillus californiensis]